MGLKIGITGGIGSGKSLVCRIFKTLGIPVYDADAEAKKLMVEDISIRHSLIDLFGDEVYTSAGELNRSYLSSQVFGNEDKLNMLNSVVHPVVIAHGTKWSKSQTAAYSIKEAALLYESGSYKSLDKIIVVTAPEHVRVQRVMKRDGVSENQVLERISKQMSEEEKVSKADYVLINDGIKPLLPQVYSLHHLLLG